MKLVGKETQGHDVSAPSNQAWRIPGVAQTMSSPFGWAAAHTHDRRSSELDFEGRTVIGHDNGATWTATQQDVLAASKCFAGVSSRKRGQRHAFGIWHVHPLQYGHFITTIHPKKGRRKTMTEKAAHKLLSF